MKALREWLQEVDDKRIGLGHFNVSDLMTLHAVVDAAREVGVPIIIGVSEGERDFMGTRQAAALVRSLREESGQNIFLNADHTHSLEKVAEAARAGYDLVLFDGSRLPFEENVARTQQAVEAAKSLSPEILVEGEVGYIGSASAIIERRPDDASRLTTPQEAQQFVRETHVDILSPAVGNMHGMLREMVTGEIRQRLDIPRIQAIKDATGAFLTLHGGSGTADEDFVAAIRAGINIVHINTELRLAWRQGVEEGLRKDANEVAPYKLLPLAYQKIRGVAQKRLELFSFLGSRTAEAGS